MTLLGLIDPPTTVHALAMVITIVTYTIVGKVENGCGSFPAGGQTNGFSQFECVNFSLNTLLVKLFSTGPLAGSHGNPWVSLSVILQPPRCSIAAIWPVCRKVYMSNAYLSFSTTGFGARAIVVYTI